MRDTPTTCPSPALLHLVTKGTARGSHWENAGGGTLHTNWNLKPYKARADEVTAMPWRGYGKIF